jgi:multiple sugar transport system substrate-binding protein
MSRKNLSRRDFIKLAGGTAAAAALAACAPAPTPAPTAAPAPTAVPATAAVVPTTAPTQASAAPGAPDYGKFPGVTVRMLAITGGNYDELYKAIPTWEQITGAKTEFAFKGDGFNTDKRLVQDFAAGTVDYDVTWDHSSFFSAYVKANGLEPLESYWTADELSDFIPRLVDATRKDGHLWVIPRHYDISCLHYRTDLMTESEVPQTWDQFKALAIKLTDSSKGIYGTQVAGKEEALTGRFYEVLTAEGGALFDDKWNPTFNSPAGVKSASMFADLYKASAMPPGITNYVWADVAKNFSDGIVGIYTEWYGWYGTFQDPKSSKVAGKFGLARAPMGDGKVHSGWAGNHGFSITKASKNKEAAASLIKFLTSPDEQRIESKLGFTVSRASIGQEAIAAAATSSVPLDKARLELALLQAKEDYKTPPLIAEWIPFSNIFYPILQKIILGDAAPQAGLDDAVKQTHDLMAKAGYYGS